MEAIISCLFGIFVGMAVAGYMYVGECEKKENRIAECIEENKLLREEVEDTKFDLFVANKETKQKDKIVEKMQVVINDFMPQEDKLKRIKELADDYQSIN